MATKSKEQTGKDSVDRLLARWAPQLPNIDLEVEAAVQRIQKLGRYVRKHMDETLGDVGLSWGEWAVLGDLRLGGEPYRASPGTLAEHAGLSSGAMTNRLDQLEKAGFVRRLPDPDDRRGVQVELTKAGHRVWLESVGVQAAKEAHLAAVLSERELVQLNRLLRRAMLGFEQNGADKPKKAPDPDK